MEMSMLYDSDTFIVLAVSAQRGRTSRHLGFEIVDKRSQKALFLPKGAWADSLQAMIRKWQQDVPQQEDVEKVLDSYSELAQNPLVVH